VNSVVTLAQALGVAYASGLNLYATVAVLGLATRFGWVDNVPSSLGPLSSTWVIVFATMLYVIDFAATLVPGIAAAWETIHSLVRPPAAAALAAATAWHGDPLFVLIAAMLGAGIGVTTHTTKLGLRYAIDASPEPVTNTATNVAELGLVATLVIAVWAHPFLALAFALVILGVLVILVRLIWRALRQVFTGHWMPARGLMQEPRASSQAITPPEE
jgi:Domain of unknown function (DUF4126)